MTIREIKGTAFITYNPKKELKALVSLASSGNIDWKPAIVLAAAYLEQFGIVRLRKFFEKKEIKLSGKFVSLSLPRVAILLYGLGITNPRYYTRMTEIWTERTCIVHPKETSQAYVGEEANSKYEKMVTNALEIIQFLQEKEGTSHE